MGQRFAFFAIAWLALLPVHAVGTAQEVDCTIQVNYEAVPTTHKDLLHDFASDLNQYINGYAWGSDNLDAKVKCTMTIYIKSAIGDNRYSAQVFIGSQRNIYGSDRNTAVSRLFDESWDFTYVKNRPINHNPYSYNDLSSFIDFYIYLILGYDYDTYERLSGTPWFQRASEVASLGRSSGDKGWQPVTSGYSRYQLIDELLSPKFTPVRAASYVYHYEGLDSLTTNRPHALANILRSVEAIGKARRRVDPRNLVIKTFFETKYLELADLFQSHEDPSVYTILSEVDPSHRTTYEEYVLKRR